MRKRNFYIDPLTKKRLEHFKSIKRARISLKILITFCFFTMIAELFINNKPIVLYYKNRLYFPLFSRFLPGSQFGFSDSSEVNYRQLQQIVKKTGSGWMIMPLIPYNAVEQDLENFSLEEMPKNHTYIGFTVSNKQDESSNPKDYNFIPLFQVSKFEIPVQNGEKIETIKLYFSENIKGYPRNQINNKTRYVFVFSNDIEKDTDKIIPQNLNSNKGVQIPGTDVYIWIKFADNEKGAILPPYKPSFKTKHILGTDRIGRDILARLVYGFRVTVIFIVLYTIIVYCIGVGVGFIMGYYGGMFDLIFQRIIEIWDLIPFIYAVMIFSAIFKPNFFLFIMIFAALGWTKKTWMIRALTFKEKERGYVQSARCFGASTSRIFFRHILPNLLPVILTSLPFSINVGISAITALDYLGFGLPPPTPSWGEILATGTSLFITAPWILLSVLTALIAVLIMITFIGEGLRESFDPKHFTIYQ